MESKAYFGALQLNKHAATRLRAEEKCLDRQVKNMFRDVWRQKEILMDDFVLINVRTPSPKKMFSDDSIVSSSSPFTTAGGCAVAADTNAIKKTSKTSSASSKGSTKTAETPTVKTSHANRPSTSVPKTKRFGTSSPGPVSTFQEKRQQQKSPTCSDRNSVTGEYTESLSKATLTEHQKQFSTEAFEDKNETPATISVWDSRKNLPRSNSSMAVLQSAKTVSPAVESSKSGEIKLDEKRSRRKHNYVQALEAFQELNAQLLHDNDWSQERRSHSANFILSVSRESGCLSDIEQYGHPTKDRTSRLNCSLNSGSCGSLSSQASAKATGPESMYRDRRNSDNDTDRGLVVVAVQESKNRKYEHAHKQASENSTPKYKKPDPTSVKDSEEHDKVQSFGGQQRMTSQLEKEKNRSHRDTEEQEQDQQRQQIRQHSSPNKTQHNQTCQLQEENNYNRMQGQQTPQQNQQQQHQQQQQRQQQQLQRNPQQPEMQQQQTDHQPEQQTTPLPRRHPPQRRLTLDPKLVLPLTAKRYRCKSQATIVPVIHILGKEATLYPNAEAKAGRVVNLDKRSRGWIARSSTILAFLDQVDDTSAKSTSALASAIRDSPMEDTSPMIRESSTMSPTGTSSGSDNARNFGPAKGHGPYEDGRGPRRHTAPTGLVHKSDASGPENRPSKIISSSIVPGAEEGNFCLVPQTIFADPEYEQPQPKPQNPVPVVPNKWQRLRGGSSAKQNKPKRAMGNPFRRVSQRKAAQDRRSLLVNRPRYI